MMSERPLPVLDSWQVRFGHLIAVLGFSIVLVVPFTLGSGFHTLTSIALSLLGGATALFGATVAAVPLASSHQTGPEL